MNPGSVRGSLPLKWFLMLAAGLFLAVPVAAFSFASKQDNMDFTTINSIINPLTISFDLDIDDKEVIYIIEGVLVVTLNAIIGDSGSCSQIGFSPGGAATLNGTHMGVVEEGDFEGLERYRISIDLTEVSFECIIGLTVVAENAGNIPLDWLNEGGDSANSDLMFSTTEGSLSMHIDTFSPDFSQVVPQDAILAGCSADPKNLVYDGDDVLTLLFGIDLSDLVIGALEDDESLLKGEVETQLCNLAGDLGNELVKVLKNNLFTDLTSDFYIQDPFLNNNTPSGIVPALQPEQDIYDQGLDEGRPIFDLTSDNFLVEILLPEGEPNPEDEPIIDTILGFLGGDSEYDAFLAFLDSEFGLDLDANDGKVVDLDLFSILDGSFFGEATGDVDLSFGETLSLEDGVITIGFNVDFTKLDLDIDPPTENSILPNFRALGKHTILIPGLDLNDLFLDIGATIRVEVENRGIPGNVLLERPFAFVLDESFGFTIDWDGFVANIGILFAFDEDELNKLHFGSLLADVFNCLMSPFLLTPRFTGITLEHEFVGVEFSSTFNDAIFVILANVITELLPIFQPVIPAGLELLADSLLTNTELLDPTECALANETLDDPELYPYSFDEGLFKDLSDIADADLFNDLLSFGETSDTSLMLMGNLDHFDGNDGNGEIILALELPPYLGYQQTFTLTFATIRILNIFPPVFNNVELLKVQNDSEFYPQFLHNELNVGSPEYPIGVEVVAILSVTEPVVVNPEDVGVIPPPPREMNAQENILTLQLQFEFLYAVLDLYMKYSQYDVDSQELGDLLNIGCWVNRINFPGGIKELTVRFEEMLVNAECEPCDNALVREMVEVFQDPASHDELSAFFNDDLIGGFASLLEGYFTEENWDATMDRFTKLCLNEGFEIVSFTDFEAYHPHGELAPLLVYLGLFGTALFIPVVIAAFFNRYGPKLKHHNQHKINHHHNVELIKHKKGQSESEEINVELELIDDAHLRKPMCINPNIPMFARLIMPFIIVGNLVLFVIGDTGSAVRINVRGHIFDVPLAFDNFAELSIITSVIELWNSGARLLGALLFILSIFWPYFKLLLLTFCWTMPPKWFGTAKRGQLIELLDILGRFSFAEFHFLVFVLVVFQIEGGTPKPAFLPQTDLFLVGLVIEPLISLFTFSLAVVVSIIVSNVFLVFQHGIENEARLQLRKQRLTAIEQAKKAQGLTDYAVDQDAYAFRVTSWDFTVFEEDFEKGVVHDYTYSVSSLATIGIGGLVLMATTILYAATTLPALKIELHGLVGFLVRYTGSPSEYEISVFELLTNVYEYYPGDAVIVFVGLVFILTIAIIPMFQTLLLLCLLFVPLSVKQARRLTELHHVVTVWCCMDVFVLAVTLTVLELPTVASGLVSVIEECNIIGQLMQDILLPMGLVTELDAQASCLAVEAFISTGAYVAVLAVLALSLANFSVSKLFYYFVEDRERIIEKQIGTDASQQLRWEIKPYHKALKRFGLIKFESKAARQQRQEANKDQLEAVQNVKADARSSKGPPTRQVSNPSFAPVMIAPANNKVAKKRVVHEKKLVEKDAQVDFQFTMSADDRIRAQLRAFFSKVDPDKLRSVDKLADRAMASSDGLYRLNQTLMDRYGATITLDL